MTEPSSSRAPAETLARPHAQRVSGRALAHHPALAILRDAALVALLTAIVLALAYQVRERVVVDVGGKQDTPFVARFFDAESAPEQTYRWTREQSRVELEGENLAAPWTLRLRLNGFRPNRPVRVAVQMNGVVVEEFLAHDGWDVYEVEGEVPPEPWTGNAVLYLVNDTFVPQQEIEGSGDSRRLGVAVDSLEFIPARSETIVGNDERWIDLAAAPQMPPGAVALNWVLGIALLYATARGIGLPRRALHLAAALAVVGVGIAFALYRPFVASATGAFFVLALVLAGIAAGGMWLLPRFAVYLGLAVSRRELGYLTGIVLLSVGLKWGGIWYPQFRSSDLNFHAHRLEFVTHGNLFFTSELPDAARRVVPYPPALYVALVPLTWLTDDDAALLNLLNPLADALAVLALYFAARRMRADTVTGDGAFALFAAFLLALSPISFWIYSWGNHTNIFAQAAADILFALLLAAPLDRPRVWLPALFLFVLAAAAHLGVFLSLLVWMPLAVLFRPFARDPNARRETAALLGLCAAGLALAALLYYAEFADALLAQSRAFIQDFGAGRAAGSGGVTWARVGDVARYTAEQFGWALLAAGVVGIAWAWGQFTRRARSIWSAWLLVGVLFALVTLGASFSTRYTLWAAPGLALSGAAVLGALWSRPRAARLVTYAICLFALLQTSWIWFDRVWNAYH